MRSNPGAASHLSLLCVCALLGPGLAPLALGQVRSGVDPGRLERIDTVVEQAIDDGLLPGAVVLVWHQGQTVYHRAFGHRALVPRLEPMSPDTIFDLASLTKVVVTTTAVMMLVEEGQVRLRDPVSRHLPGFERHGKDGVTVEHLLTHMSGLRPDLPLDEEFDGYDAAIARALDERPVSAPGESFTYSDINFFLLGDIVARVSGLSLDEFAERQIFRPLAMRDTRFGPLSQAIERTAPTESCRPLGWPCGGGDGSMLRGTVHDPTARRMGGVAGHAGLFGTARDLARLAAMLLSEGTLDGVRLLSPLTVRRMTSPATPAAMGDVRGLGWDIDSRFSSNRGDLFGRGSYGHTGFTGTSMWVDPASDTAVIFLSSRVHPDGAGNVTALRGTVATLAAAAIHEIELASDAPGPVRLGVDRLVEEEFERLAGTRVALVTNQTGRATDGTSTIDLLHTTPRVDLRRLLSPEHGIRGDVDDIIEDSIDPGTGLTVHSLYGDTRRPSPEMLEGLDAIVVDLQDVGSRFYTYATTMAYVMEAAAIHDIRVVVLDRPNPITGLAVEGPLLEPELFGFTGTLSMPIRHGLTMGELARLIAFERGTTANLEVVPMSGWRRGMWYDETGLRWIAPSPNLRTVNQATLYPGIGAIEQSNLSVGRGTDAPFERVGAPWIDGVKLAEALNARQLAGVRFYPVEFVPASSRYAGERCGGVSLIVTRRRSLRPVRVGIEVAAAIHRLYPARFDIDAMTRLLGSRKAVARLKAGDDAADIASGWSDGDRAWQERVAPHLLYRR